MYILIMQQDAEAGLIHCQPYWNFSPFRDAAKYIYMFLVSRLIKECRRFQSDCFSVSSVWFNICDFDTHCKLFRIMLQHVSLFKA